VNELNWPWIALGAAIPAVVSVLVAIPFWRKDQMILGNIAGTVVLFGSALGLILREHGEIDRVTKACLQAGATCFPEPSAFTRFAIYASIGVLESALLFSLSLKIERRRRGRDYAPEWRR
jgi:hypothetical protein